MTSPKRVFVLCTGRCGSSTLYRACQNITNWQARHESQTYRYGGRVTYPEGVIEIDNRLSFFLGSLDKKYGDDPVYVHLTRDPDKVAESFVRTSFGTNRGIMDAFAGRIVRKAVARNDRLRASSAFVQTTNDNIELFLKDKSKVVRMSIEDPHGPFDKLCSAISAEGDLDKAHEALNYVYGKRSS